MTGPNEFISATSGKTICLRGRVGRRGDEIENQVPGDVQNFQAPVGILDDGLNDQTYFRQLAVLRVDVVGKAGRAGVNADAGDEPGLGSLRFGWGSVILACVPATTCETWAPSTISRNCLNAASDQTGSRFVGSCGSGVVMSRTAIRLAKSAACVGAGNSQETSFAESACTGRRRPGLWLRLRLAGPGTGAAHDQGSHQSNSHILAEKMFRELCMRLSSVRAPDFRPRIRSTIGNSQGLEIFDQCAPLVGTEATADDAFFPARSSLNSWPELLLPLMLVSNAKAAGKCAGDDSRDSRDRTRDCRGRIFSGAQLPAKAAHRRWGPSRCEGTAGWPRRHSAAELCKRAAARGRCSDGFRSSARARLGEIGGCWLSYQ